MGATDPQQLTRCVADGHYAVACFRGATKDVVVQREDHYRLRPTARGRAAHTRMVDAFHRRYHRLIATMTARERDALSIGLPALIRALRHISQE